ncbi:MAG: alpha/beta fold hydrolase [Gemmatimonadales bacterium]
MRRLLPLLPLLAAPLAAQDSIRPPASLVADQMPAVPAALAERAGRYGQYRSAGLLDWHPTRREILIRTRFADAPQVHQVRVPGGDRRQLTFEAEPIADAMWQPTRGDYLVFRRDQGGDEFFQLYRQDSASGAITRLTDGKSRNTGGVWNRAGTALAYESTRRNGTEGDLWVIDPRDPRSDRMAVRVTGTGWGARDWSPDGKMLLVGHFISVNQSELWLADVATGALTMLTRADSGKQVSYAGAVFSRDGKAIYYLSDKDSEFLRLCRRDLATGAVRVLTANIPWDIEQFALSDDGLLVAYIANEDGYGRLHLASALTGSARRLPALPSGLVGSLHWRPKSRELGFTISSWQAPGDVWSLDVATGKVTRWTESETGGLDFSDLPAPELVHWKAPDGLTISGFLYRPAARFGSARPVVVSIHGGPEGQSRPGFQGRWNYLLEEQGVALLLPNIRGSTGYGKTYLAADNGVRREAAYGDIGAMFDWIKTRPDLDFAQVLVMGGSYGGHMTLVTASRYADRISAAVDVVGISNLATFLEHTSSYRRDLRRVEYGDERDSTERAFMQRTAPLNNAKAITKPLLVVQGANDPRVPRSEAEQIVQTVRANGTPVWYLLGLDEGHGFQKKGNADYQFYVTLVFLERYLSRGGRL